MFCFTQQHRKFCSRFSFRFLMLRKKPTRRKAGCAMIILLSLFICLLPKIVPSIDEKSDSSSNGASGIAGVLWPLCLMIESVPFASFNVYTEKILKNNEQSSKDQVGILCYMFWLNVYQMLLVFCFFWVDIVPGFGYTHNIEQFLENFTFGFRCFFGGAGCDETSGLRGTMYILMSLLTFVAGAGLIKYSEGATLAAIISVRIILAFYFGQYFVNPHLVFILVSP
ncbi:uncharacterized protein LOC124442903 [Xenia sp. Carnegie-2017]|uniref:uncharacterized protein LOC124442903 n=1 Tax=Xenia sp. Carnegie-2017 TaxID=2897299 RepID=UPI001F04A94B|nr:uncharacterized protein LOC124442903 [Xenia sp. Carnegie-2017]